MLRTCEHCTVFEPKKKCEQCLNKRKRAKVNSARKKMNSVFEKSEQ